MINKVFKCFLLLIIFLGVFLFQTNFVLADAESVIIPDVSNKSYKQGAKELGEALKPLNCHTMPAIYEYVNDYSLHNVILRTMPVGGSKVLRCGSVTTVVGRHEKLFPNVKGMTKGDAISAIRNAGFDNEIKIEEMEIKGQPRGKVYSQAPMETSPASAIPSSYKIKLTIVPSYDDGKHMPDLIGMTEEEAKKKYNSLGIPNKLYVSYYDYSDKPNNLVAYQQPNPGFDITKLHVSQGLSITVQKTGSESIPALGGMTVEDAEKKLRDLGFTNIWKTNTLFTDKQLVEHPSLKTYVGKVYTTKPSGGTYPKNTYIEIFIGKSESPIPGVSVVKIPNVGQLKEESAVALLKHKGLVPKVTYKSTFDNFLPGTASSITNPKHGTTVKAGTEVKITVYRFKPKVPSLKYFSKEDAVKMLKDRGLKYEFSYVSTANKSNDNKVASQSIEANKEVDPGTLIKITLYRFDQVAVPNLVDMTEEKAVSYLKEFKSELKYEIIRKTTASLLKDKKVYSVEPQHKTILKPGDKIKIYVYKLLKSTPNVVGKYESSAVSELQNLGFEVKKEYKISNEVGKVIEQSLEAGKSPLTSYITLWIGKKPDNIQLPNLVGMSQSEAVEKIRQLKTLSYEVKEYKLFDRAKDGKVYSTHPAANKLVEYDSKVFIYIGKYVHSVPNVVGKSVKDAENTMRNAGFQPTIVYIKDGTPGKVVNQLPNANSIPTSSKINLFVKQSDNAAQNAPPPWLHDYVVPPLRDFSLHEARMMLASNKLNYKIEYVYSTSTREGKVISTNYPAGTRLKPEWGYSVVLRVAARPFTAPSLIGMSEQQAVSAIRRMNKKPIVHKDKSYSSSRGKTVVIRQFPEPGTRGQSSYMDITVSNNFRVPNLIGKSFNEAIPMLQDAALRYKIDYVPVEKGKLDWKVIECNPEPGRNISFDGIVNLKVGRMSDLVPSVIGKSESEAIKILENANLFPQKVYKDSNTSNNVVIAQSQSPGLRKTDSNITIILGIQSSLSSITTPTPEAIRPKLAASVQVAPQKEIAKGNAVSQPPQQYYALKVSDDERNKINELYSNLQKGYDYSDEYQIVDLLSENWESADGSTVQDVEDNLRNKFNVYDTIQCNINNITINKTSSNQFQVSYDIKITGKIYDADITREEKSSVVEKVLVENGKYRIYKTLSGKFWYKN